MRVHHTDDGDNVSIPRALLRDQNLTWAARGLLLDLLGRHDGDSSPSINSLIEEARSSGRKAEGHTVVGKLLRELEANEYFIRRKTRYGGKRGNDVVEVYDTPQEFHLEEPAPTMPEPSIDISHTGEVVYLIGEPGSPIVKIGTTRNLKNRFRALQSSSPSRLDVLWFTAGGEELEYALHDRFSAARQHGEWFLFEEADPVMLVPAAAKELALNVSRD